MGCFLEFHDPDGSRAVVVEDDGRVAYAYLLDDARKIVGDVWLYNVGAAPETVDWGDRACMPFLQPERLCAPHQIAQLSDGSDIACEWSERHVKLRVGGEHIATLAAGAKPGWSRGASAGGPLARPLAELLE